MNLIILLTLLLALSKDIFPGEDWKSGIISLGGGDDMFYMLFKSRDHNPNAPLVLWLTGGPGCSLSNGLMEENGPYLFGWDLIFKKNQYSWNNNADVLYVDNPVGTGFSQAATLCKDEHCVAQNLYIFLSKFMIINPAYLHRPFFVTGESYAGHYIAAFSAYLAKSQNGYINFKGAAIGNGLVNAIAQYDQYSNYLYENRRIDGVQYAISQFETMAACDIPMKVDVKKAEDSCDKVVDDLLTRGNIINIYNINMKKNDDNIMDTIYQFMISNSAAFNVPNDGRQYSMCNHTVHRALSDRDWFVSFADDVAYTIEHGIPVLVYSGDLDFICNWMGGMAWVHEMKWSGKSAFNALDMSPYMFNGKSYGTIKTHDKLSFLRIYNAGHLVPMDAPEFSLKMLSDFIANATK